MGNENSTPIFEGRAGPKLSKPRGCDYEDGVMEIVGSLKSTIASRRAGHVSRNAVNLAWILTKFMVAYPEIRRQRMSTQDVVEKIIKQEVLPLRGKNAKQAYATYADLLKETGSIGSKEIVSDGHPFFYVVHVWSRPFSEMIDQMITYCLCSGLKPNETFVWIDAFAINQWTASLSGSTTDDAMSLVEEVIMDAQETLVIIDPSGLILRRMWCLWEVWTTLRLKPSGKAAIIPLRYGLKMEPLKGLVKSLDIKDCRSGIDTDKSRLLMSIEASIGGSNSMSWDLKSLFLLLKDTDPVAQEQLVNYQSMNPADIEL